jgi:hypothetical protein
MSHVFVSHSKSDKRITEIVCESLAAEGIPTWASFLDIPSGSNWDESIETALRGASAVIVIVSPASVRSDYVRAEVEEAIRRQKTVIPVVTKAADLPLRWRMLQYVKWSSAHAKRCVRQIASGLPQTTASQLREALDNPSRFDDVRALILKHTEWLPLEYYMALDYTFKTNALISAGSRADCFAGRLDTIGPRAYLYYLGSPYRTPIYRSGAPSPHLRELLVTICGHSLRLRTKMGETHQLAPKRLFRAELWGWRETFPYYTSLKVYVIIGRRRHYRGCLRAARERIVAEINKDLFPREPYYGGGFEIMSYDRILDTLSKRAARRSPRRAARRSPR